MAGAVLSADELLQIIDLQTKVIQCYGRISPNGSPPADLRRIRERSNDARTCDAQFLD
jgi:hypothetical protein